MNAADLLKRARDIASYAVGNTFYDCAKFAEAVIPLLERESARELETEEMRQIKVWATMKPGKLEEYSMAGDRAFQRTLAVFNAAISLYASSYPKPRIYSFEMALAESEDFMREVEAAK